MDIWVGKESKNAETVKKYGCYTPIIKNVIPVLNRCLNEPCSVTFPVDIEIDDEFREVISKICHLSKYQTVKPIRVRVHKTKEQTIPVELTRLIMSANLIPSDTSFTLEIIYKDSKPQYLKDIDSKNIRYEFSESPLEAFTFSSLNIALEVAILVRFKFKPQYIRVRSRRESI